MKPSVEPLHHRPDAGGRIAAPAFGAVALLAAFGIGTATGQSPPGLSLDRQWGSGTAAGYNAGASAVYWFGPRTGVGTDLVWSRASVDLEGSGDGGVAVDVDVGGLRTSVGLRVRFGMFARQARRGDLK